MDPIKLRDLLKIYERIDLYRAKYRHNDFTPNAWCFHGNKTQGWTGSAKNNRLYFAKVTGKAPLTINAGQYKYISTKVCLQYPTLVTNSIKIRVSNGIPCVNDYLYNKGVPTTSLGISGSKVSVSGTYFITAASVVDGAAYASYAALDEAWAQYMNNLLKVENDLVLGYKTGTSWNTKVGKVLYSQEGYTVLFDMSAEAAWTGTVNEMRIEVVQRVPEWVHMSDTIACEYIKVDKENVFANIASDASATVLDFNEMRRDLELFAKQDIDWSNPGPASNPNEVRAFKDSIRYTDLSQVNSKISTLSPYNGCSTCDNHQCQCNQAAHGHVACQTCNGCNSYAPCASCDKTCYQQPVACACNGTCFQQPIACTCNGICYGYQSCTAYTL